jgi:hydrogenase maturation protease
MAVQLSSPIVVIGVGNVIRSDDGVGVHAARLLQLDSRVPAGIKVLDGGTMGPELVSFACDASHLLLLDAMNSGALPGTLGRMNGSDLLATRHGSSVHQLAVGELISALFLIASRRQEILLFGVQPANVDWGATLSAEVQAALGSLVDAAVAQLQLWNESRSFNREFQTSSFPPGPSQQESPSIRSEEGSPGG